MTLKRFSKSALEELALLWDPFRIALQTPESLADFVQGLGWGINAKKVDMGVAREVFSIVEDLEKVQELISSNLTGANGTLFQEVDQALDILANVAQKIRSISLVDLSRVSLNNVEPPNDLLEAIINELIVRYLETVWPKSFAVLALLGIAEEEEAGQTETEENSEYIRRRLNWATFRYLDQPATLWKKTFGWGDNFDWLGFLLRVRDVLQGIGITAVMESNRDKLNNSENKDQPEYEFLEVEFLISEVQVVVFKFLPLMEALAVDNSKAGLQIAITVADLVSNGQLFESFVENRGVLMSNGTYLVEARPRSIRWLHEEADVGEVDAALILTDKLNSTLTSGGAPDDPITASEVGIGLIFKGETDVEVGLEFSANDVELHIEVTDGDSFVESLIGSGRFSLFFSLVAGFSSKEGFYFKGGTKSRLRLLSDLRIKGVMIHSVDLILNFRDDSIRLACLVSVGGKIGPVTAQVKELGLKGVLDFETPGLLGTADLSLDFHPPTAIGISVDAEGITGGGFLKIAPPNYAGMMQLSFNNEIELTAFGLITTKLPDGTDGFSLVIQIMAEFQPIQMGMGFALTGVGGLIGINRQINEEGMKAAFKNHSLDVFLFPENPIKDAVKIIESIQTIMPPREGYHIIGPMVQMFWGGSVRLVEFEVGIFIQTGGPLKIIIIGQARTQLPEGDAPRLIINMDVLGIIDFGEDRVAIDAALFNSRILNFTLDGKMALRSDWSSGEESFALSVGGFHPQFQNIPAGFPQLTRLMVAIGSGNPRLTLQMYLAITPNTLQIGAQFDLWAKKSGFTITGGTSFHALFTFSPFSFLVIVKFWVEIRGIVDLGVDLEFELSGPNPMIAKGYAKFKVGWFSKKVRFRKQFGDRIPDPLPVVSPLAVLLAELKNERSIRFELPAWATASLVFTETAELKIDPVADIIISQNAVPLNFNIQRFGGGRPPKAEQNLSITAKADNEQITKTLFAPEQFKNWTVEERLAAKPFEKYDAGIRFSGEYIIPEEAIEERRVEFETVLRESQSYLLKHPKDKACVTQTTVFEAQYFINWSLFGSNRYFKPLRKVRDENQPNFIKIIEPGYILTGNDEQDGKLSGSAGQNHGAMSYAEALDAYKQASNTNATIRSAADVILQ